MKLTDKNNTKPGGVSPAELLLSKDAVLLCLSSFLKLYVITTLRLSACRVYLLLLSVKTTLGTKKTGLITMCV